jgi:hypothetical protein
VQETERINELCRNGIDRFIFNILQKLSIVLVSESLATLIDYNFIFLVMAVHVEISKF